MHRFFYLCFANPQLYKAALIRCDLEKLELFGDDYIFECVKIYSQEKQYRAYITDAIQMIAENTTKPYGGKAPSMRYMDMVEPKPVDTRSAMDIVAEVNSRCGLTMIDDDTEEGDS